MRIPVDVANSDPGHERKRLHSLQNVVSFSPESGSSGLRVYA